MSFSSLEKQGYKYRVVSISHFDELKKQLIRLRKQNLLSESIYKLAQNSFSFEVPGELPDAKSIIVVAVPQPQLEIAFNWKNKTWKLILPPTYQHREPHRKVEDMITADLAQDEYRVAEARLPVKLLAVCSGLASYGKNNIAYVSSFGSFHRLVAFYSDFPLEEDSWQEMKMMDRCKSCQSCLKACPTGAVTSERFLLRAEKCLTYFNEEPGDFPVWIERSWHNCLMGCMYCQKVCPLNKDMLGWIDRGAEFSSDETELLLEGTVFGNLPPDIQEVLRCLDLVDYYEVLSRNLGVLLES